MKNFIVLIIVAFFGMTMNAQKIKSNKNAKHNFIVSGNCEMCQKRIQKAALSVAGVKLATWNVETNVLNLILNEEINNVQEVKNAIAKAGYDTKETKAKEIDYLKLPECCKYDRK